MSSIQYAKFNGFKAGSTGAADQPGGGQAYTLPGPYVAAGAFSDGVGLPTTITSLATFHDYVAALEAKTTGIVTSNVDISVSNASSEFVLLGGHGYDTLSAAGSTGDGVIWGRDADDSLVGGAGDDTLAPGDGNDTLIGGAGNNTVSYVDVSAPVRVDLGLPDSDPQDIGSYNEYLYDIQNIIGSSFNDVLEGDGVANRLYGGAGDDTLRGGDGKDSLYGGDGADTIDIYTSTGYNYGGRGNDLFLFYNGGGYLDGGQGADDFAFMEFAPGRSAVLGRLEAHDTVDLSGAAFNLGFNHFTAVRHFDGHGGEITAQYDAERNRTIYKVDFDGDGHSDYKLDAKHGHYDYANFYGVDASGVSHAQDPGGLVS